MSVPFAMRWEVSSLRWNHGSFVEAARVRPLQRTLPGDWWVERPFPGLRSELEARLQRRWWLASKLSSPAWPALVDAGTEAGVPWAVIESPGHRAEGAFPLSSPRAAVAAVHGLAVAVAEAEALLERHLLTPALALTPAVVGRDDAGQLRLHLAALDVDRDEGFPSNPRTWLWTPEAWLGQPATARTNVFALGWLLSLALTGKAPWPMAEGQSEKGAREAMKPLVLGGRAPVVPLPAELEALAPVLRRALHHQAPQRFASARSLAEALAPHAGAAAAARARPASPVALPMPPFEARREWLPPALEQQLAAAPVDEAGPWVDLARALEGAHALRARLIHAQRPGGDEATAAALTAHPELAVHLPGDALTPLWRLGYVRSLEAAPAGKEAADFVARSWEVAALLQHPSLRFLRELTLAGSLTHAKAWLEALQRTAPPALRHVTVMGVAPSEPLAVELGLRFPRWTWAWGRPTGASGSSLLRRLLGG